MIRERRKRAARTSLRALVAVLLAVGLSAPGRAEPPPDEPSDKPSKDWEVELLPYAWLPGLDASLETQRGTRHIDVSASDILGDLQLGAMGRLSARWQRWLLVADGLWVKLEQKDDAQRSFVRLDAEVDLDLALAQGLVGRRIYARPGGLLRAAEPGDERSFAVDVLAGVDYVDYSAEIEIERSAGVVLPEAERNLRISESWVSPAIGLRLHNDFTPRIRFETLGTWGGFAVGDAPDRLWQLTTLLSYRFTDHWLVSAGHRLFLIDDGRYGLRMHGATLGVGYRF